MRSSDSDSEHMTDDQYRRLLYEILDLKVKMEEIKSLLRTDISESHRTIISTLLSIAVVDEDVVADDELPQN